MIKHGNRAKNDTKDLWDEETEKKEKMRSDIKSFKEALEGTRYFTRSLYQFYQSLIEEGFNPDQAFDLTRDYMISILGTASSMEQKNENIIMPITKI